ncbi:MAG: ABC transporter ATP-binding protein [Gammaproteobacteria bacterium]
MSTPAAILTERLAKSYGAVAALAGLDLAIEAGQFFALLGRNGSGKTTTLQLLSTLMRPSGGRAWVAGHDILTSPLAVRRQIGMVFQEPALDRHLTVMENLRFAGALSSLSARTLRERAADLLKLFGLAEARDTRVAALSGGMRRALDIARGILHRPRILLLDEPTIGLDVQNRRAIWQHLDRLRSEEGTTLLLTTHHLEEAAGCDRVAFMSRGRLIGQGSPNELVGALGEYVLEVETESPAETASHLRPRFGEPLFEGERLLFRVAAGAVSLDHLTHELRVHARAIRLRRPDLNDVYLWIHRDPPDDHPAGPEGAAGAS